MKRFFMTLLVVGLLVAGSPAVFATLGQLWDLDELTVIYEEDIDGDYEILEVTPDGHIVIVHRGKVYILETKNK
jgi:hypothetical protein